MLYLGEKPWDGPKCLYDMFDVNNVPEELREYIVDYPMFLVEVREIKNLERFKTDIRYVFGFIQNTSDKAKMSRYIEENREVFEDMPEDAYDFMSSVSHTKELKQVKEKYKISEEA